MTAERQDHDTTRPSRRAARNQRASGRPLWDGIALLCLGVHWVVHAVILGMIQAGEFRPPWTIFFILAVPIPGVIAIAFIFIRALFGPRSCSRTVAMIGIASCILASISALWFMGQAIASV